MCSRAFTTSLLALLAIASPVERRTVVQIENDFSKLKSDYTITDGTVEAFSNTNGTLGEAFNIHTEFSTLDDDTKNIFTDFIATGPITGADVTTIIDDFIGVGPIIIKTLQDIIAKHQGFANVATVPFVESDLQKLQNDTQALGDGLISVAPSTVLPTATPVINSINAAFSSAVSVFAS